MGLPFLIGSNMQISSEKIENLHNVSIFYQTFPIEAKFVSREILPTYIRKFYES